MTTSHDWVYHLVLICIGWAMGTAPIAAWLAVEWWRDR